MKNRVRIIAGRWRGRKLVFPDIAGLRPTADRARETLFNWIQQDTAGARCLDLYSGSGALGFEAASREATSVLLIERDRQAFKAICENIERFGAAEKIQVKQTDACQFLNGPAQAFDLVFVDPPFGSGLVKASCQALNRFGWLSTNAKIYVEMEGSANLSGIPADWRILRQKKAGTVVYYLFESKNITL